MPDDKRDLFDVYQDWQKEMRGGGWSEVSLTGPLLIDPTERYLNAERRVLFVGQETRQWGWTVSDEAAERAGVISSSPQNAWNFADFLENDDGVQAMLAAYRSFAFAKYDPVVGRSPFWRTFRRFDERPNHAALWTNVCRCAFNAEEGGHSLFRLEETQREAFVAAQAQLARSEIDILRPDICLIFSGPYYDPITFASFEGTKLEPIEGFPERVLARVVHPALPEAAYRTYHPSYLQRSNQMDRVLGKIEDLILHSA